MVKEIEAILCFCIFVRNSKIGYHFFAKGKFLESGRLLLRYPAGRNLSRLMRQQQFFVLEFLAKILNFTLTIFLSEENIFKMGTEKYLLVENEITLPLMVKGRRNIVFCIFAQDSKSHNGGHFKKSCEIKFGKETSLQNIHMQRYYISYYFIILCFIFFSHFMTFSPVSGTLVVDKR